MPYEANDFDDVFAYISSGYSVEDAFVLAYMDANPERFYLDGKLLSETDDVDTAKALLLEEYSAKNIIQAIKYGLMVGTGENPYSEPPVKVNVFNSANGLHLNETDVQLNDPLTQEPYFVLNRNYDSGGALFRPSSFGINRDNEVLSNYFIEHDLNSILPLELKANSEGIGSGWSIQAGGTAVMNYHKFNKKGLFLFFSIKLKLLSVNTSLI